MKVFQRILRNLLSVGVFAILIIVCLGFFGITFTVRSGALHMVYLEKELGLVSPNGEYRLIELMDSGTGRMLVYVVQQKDEWDEWTEMQVIVNPALHSRYTGAIRWLPDSNGFVIVSSDVGEIEYRLQGEKWENPQPE